MGTDGKPLPVLVAIAPTDAIDYDDLAYSPDPDADGMHHRPPQLSTGDGYYITQQNIYCLALPSTHTSPFQCAPSAPSAPISGNYVPIQISHKGSHWDWWTVAQGSTAQTALILPMPDSITNDGTWQVKFAAKFDVSGNSYNDDGVLSHSTGLILHYQKTLNQFGLVKCTSAPATGHTYFGASDCNQSATVNDNRTDTYLENSGTLRVEMKAPDTIDGCDLHVRLAHRQMASLLNFIDALHKFIEPAFYVDEDNIAFDNDKNGHPCLSDELNNLGSIFPFRSDTEAEMVKQKRRSGGGLPPTVKELDTLLKNFDQFSVDFQQEVGFSKADSEKYDLADLTLAQESIKQARSIRGSLNTEFPRISQLIRIATLLQLSNQATVRMRKHMVGLMPLKAWVELLGLSHQLDDYNGPGKSAGDCLANLILVTDNP